VSEPYQIDPNTEEPAPPFQVLDLDGSLRQTPTHLPSDLELQDSYRLMRFVRILDEQFLNAQRQGRISFYGTCTGQEAAVLGSALALETGDSCVQALREGAAALLRGYSLVSYVNQVFGNQDDVTFGRQMPCHYTDVKNGYLSFLSPVVN
jgi:2-oxoisovalerate dehydrogenase E1 component alpha subunit